MAIPKVSIEAIEEAQGILNKIAKEDSEKMKQFFENYGKTFKEKQPEYFNWLSGVIQYHAQNTKGFMTAAQMATYCMVIINSLYIQEEIDTVSEIFNFDENSFYDNFKKDTEENIDDSDENKKD